MIKNRGFVWQICDFCLPLNCVRTGFEGTRARKNSKIIWFFPRLFVPLQTINIKCNKIMDDYPAENYNV